MRHGKHAEVWKSAVEDHGDFPREALDALRRLEKPAPQRQPKLYSVCEVIPRDTENIRQHQFLDKLVRYPSITTHIICIAKGHCAV